MTATTISAMDLRKSIGDILNRIQYSEERFIVERTGHPVAAIVSVEELERLERLETEREAELLHLAKRAAEDEGTVPFAAVVKQYQDLHGGRLDLPTNA